MPPVAASVREKIKRAGQHFDQLDRDIEGFVKSKPYELRHEFNANTGQKAVVYYPTTAIPLLWSIRLGEMLYDLRSALDHVVYGLGPIKGCEFPIFTRKDLFYPRDDAYTDKSGIHKISGISNARTRAYIESVQPFNKGQRKDGIPVFLSWLQSLCNIDKHRTLHLCRLQADSVRWQLVPGLSLSGIDLGVGRKLEGRTELAHYSPTTPDSEMEVWPEITFHVAFNEGVSQDVTREPVIAVLRGILGGVEAVVNELEATLV